MEHLTSDALYILMQGHLAQTDFSRALSHLSECPRCEAAFGRLLQAEEDLVSIFSEGDFLSVLSPQIARYAPLLEEVRIRKSVPWAILKVSSSASGLVDFFSDLADVVAGRSGGRFLPLVPQAAGLYRGNDLDVQVDANEGADCQIDDEIQVRVRRRPADRVLNVSVTASNRKTELPDLVWFPEETKLAPIPVSLVQDPHDEFRQNGTFDTGGQSGILVVFSSHRGQPE